MEEPARVSRLNLSVRNIIVKYSKQGLSNGLIQKILLNKHYVKTTTKSIRLFLKRYKETGLVTIRRTRNARFQKLKDIHKKFLDLWIGKNNELTSRILKLKLEKTFGVHLTTGYISKIRKALGWTACQAKYCQLISHQNKLKRLRWCLNSLSSYEDFDDVIFMDESKVEMSGNGRLYFYQRDSAIQPKTARKGKPKHVYSVNVWGGISYRGRTDICIFSGVMDSEIYQKILQNNLLPFAEKIFPDGYRIYQDNDSKHNSQSTKKWMEERNVLHRVMETPASSPDLNPIENVWSAMKWYLQAVIKPRKKEELIRGIVSFWQSLTAEDCGRYIDHIHKVIPYVVLNDGGPSGF